MTTRSLLTVHRLSDLDARLGRRNNLNLVRQILALLVVFSHSYLLHGKLDEEPMVRWIRFSNLGAISVWSFFLISGYLISKSGDRSSPTRFFAARAVRIFPALTLAVVGCTFLVGPVETNLPLSEYLAEPVTYRYLRRVLLQKVPDSLPGVFEEGWILHTVNQPLWTLPSEWTFYGVILTVFTVRGYFVDTIPRRYGWLVCLMMLASAIAMFPLPWRNAAGWFGFGTLGCLSYFFRGRILLFVPAAVTGIVGTIVLLSVMRPAGAAVLPLTLGYALLVFGYHPALQIEWYRRFGDYSYGTYVYAWPIQQIMFPHSADAMHLFSLSCPLTLVVAAVSWHLVEKPALSLLTPRTSRE